MDGGRILRAYLASHLGRARGTIIAFRVGVVLAVCTAVSAIFLGYPMLVVLAGFIGFAGYMECKAVRRTESIRGFNVEHLVIIDGLVVPRTSTVNDMIGILMHSPHHTLAVSDGESISAVIPRIDIVEKMAKGEANRTAGEMGHSIGVTLSTSIEEALKDLRLWKSVLVYDENGDFAGVLDREAVDRWLNHN